MNTLQIERLKHASYFGGRTQQLKSLPVLVSPAITCPTDDYPTKPVLISHTAIVYTSCKTLREYLTTVSPAMSRDLIRHNLRGICLRKGVVVSCDGHRLTEVTDNNIVMPANKTEMIISSDCVTKLLKVIPKTGEAILRYARSPNGSEWLVVDLPGNVTITSKLIDGQYPDYKQVIPRQNSQAVFRFQAKPLKSALELAIKQTTAKSRAIKITEVGIRFCTEPGKPVIVPLDIELDGSFGEKDELGLSAKYLLDTIPRNADEVSIRFMGNSSPAIVMIDHHTNPLQVIMSMRLK